ncbi:MAG TPA: hypothetical protein PLN21_06095 [Gemmatales bacterium]|nr:hypothetical protein [Gemmatales bacterium]
MMYHPTIRAKGLPELVDEFARQQFVNSLVHGTLIGLMGLLVVGFSSLSSRMGWQHTLVRTAFISFCMGVMAMIAAALISGFIIPEFVEGYQARTAQQMKTSDHGHAVAVIPAEPSSAASLEQIKSMLQIMGLARSGNQVCSRMGVLASAISYLLWSLALLRYTGRVKWVGIFGTFAGLLLSAALLLGFLPMNVHGMLVYVGVQACWSVAVGWMMLTGRI